jgi:hypothetical protein
MDIHGPGIPGPCVFLECGDFAITFTFAASKQRAYTNTGLLNDTKIVTRLQETGDSRVAVTGMDHK